LEQRVTALWMGFRFAGVHTKIMKKDSFSNLAPDSLNHPGERLEPMFRRGSALVLKSIFER